MVVLKQRTTQIPVLTFLYCPNQRVVLGYPGPVPYTQIQEIQYVSSEICILAPKTIIFCTWKIILVYSFNWDQDISR